ncbi:MAG: hypothetical protein EOM08_06335 [Clostridia bacterium]|nr:hypothetical protein [Clostridia bacterium]NCC76037.1 hypothetical protein [Clostridia bacterium]
MDIINSLFTSLFGISVVFAVLVALILLIYGQSLVMKSMHRVKPAAAASEPAPSNPVTVDPAPAARTTVPGKLELVGIDEKTAALVMAIICDESGIPANELIFKSIREIA